MDKKIKKAYQEYLKLPKATINGENKNAELYSKTWCIYIGRSCAHPNPHRHFTLIEFAYFLGKDEEFFNRFFYSN